MGLLGCLSSVIHFGCRTLVSRVVSDSQESLRELGYGLRHAERVFLSRGSRPVCGTCSEIRTCGLWHSSLDFFLGNKKISCAFAFCFLFTSMIMSYLNLQLHKLQIP